MRTALGASDGTIWADPAFQSECVDVVSARLPEADFRDPSSYVETDENWFNPLRRYCPMLSLFSQIIDAAGIELTHDSFRAGAESLTDFAIPGYPAASLSADKTYAADAFTIGVYDHTEGDGMAVPSGDFVDIFE